MTSRRAEPHRSRADVLVLHSLRCIGVAELGRVPDACGLPEGDAESALIDLGAAGLVTYRGGVFAGWGLTDAGHSTDAAQIDDELDAAGARSAIEETYDRFLPLNVEVLDLCTAWQTRTTDGRMIMNDHHDVAYDAAVLDRLAAHHRKAVPILDALAEVLARFDPYKWRLGDAVARALDGELEYVADGMSSYHAVWFQLHEDLLATLGIPRQ